MIRHAPQQIMYLTGVSNSATMAMAETTTRLGVLIGPATAGGVGARADYRSHIPEYRSWAADNGCFANSGAFDECEWLGMLADIVETVDGAWMSCLFAVAPDVFDPVAQRGDWRATLERSAAVLPKIRQLGLPAALVFQDGIQNHVDQINWDSFDVAFLGGSDGFKLGHADKRVAGVPHYRTSGNGADDEQTLAWARMLERCHSEGKAIHVGRVNSKARMAFSLAIGAESADGTFLARAGTENGLPQIERWLDTTAVDLCE